MMLGGGMLLVLTLGLMAAEPAGDPEGIPIDAPGGDLPVKVVSVPVQPPAPAPQTNPEKPPPPVPPSTPDAGAPPQAPPAPDAGPPIAGTAQTPDAGAPLETAPPGTALPPSHPDQPPPRGRVTYVPITSSSFDKQDLIDDHPTSSAFDAEDRIDAHPVP